MFENFAISDETTRNIALKRWGEFQLSKGRLQQDVVNHLDRYGKEYFPITVDEHIALLKDCGFNHVQVFWQSYMQVGIYAIK